MTENAHGLVEIGRLIFTFARTNRATYHEDGVTHESDTDHTVMVSVCACALAEKVYPDSLDRGLIAQFGLVHDLVEAYAYDTDSFGITDEGRQEKERREHEAFVRIEKEFKEVYPWISETIQRYEALDTREARFLKTVDKLMSKISHILNGGAYFKLRNMDEQTMWRNYQMMVKAAEEKYAAEFPELIALMDELITEAKKVTYGV
jgi:5'-deoxynucleotidase YfbR-like HD superfamily hydrolase